MKGGENTSYSFFSGSPSDTRAFGKAVGALIKGGESLALTGELGAGKTTLVQAIASAVGVGTGDVCSPSYTILNEYFGRIPVYHFDLYRLEDAGDVHDLGFEEYFGGDGLSMVEWADIAPDLLPPEHLKISIFIRGDEERLFEVSASGEHSEKILEGIRKKLG